MVAGLDDDLFGEVFFDGVEEFVVVGVLWSDDISGWSDDAVC